MQWWLARSLSAFLAASHFFFSAALDLGGEKKKIQIRKSYKMGICKCRGPGLGTGRPADVPTCSVSKLGSTEGATLQAREAEGIELFSDHVGIFLRDCYHCEDDSSRQVLSLARKTQAMAWRLPVCVSPDAGAYAGSRDALRRVLAWQKGVVAAAATRWRGSNVIKYNWHLSSMYGPAGDTIRKDA